MTKQDSSNALKEELPGSTTERVSLYPGDYREDDVKPLEESGYRALAFEDAAELVCFYDKGIQNGDVTLYPWQVAVHETLASKEASARHPMKFCLVAANGSGKDAFIAAPFAVWFALCKVQSRVIITSSSGTQLTGQTEPAIRNLCETINAYHGEEIFKIRQRYIRCRLSGSEIRMFATDESGKAEGYHPIVPNAEMAILVNEGKSVTDEIHNALRRCTGYTHWLEYSSPGEPKGFFYNAACNWKNVRYVTSYDCFNHLFEEEREQDKLDLGEHSALFRSKHLAEFTSIGGEVVITQELMNKCLLAPPQFTLTELGDRVGIDLAAGGDENSLCFLRANKVRVQYHFRETDTTITADKIERILTKEGITKKHEFIFADDGGVGRAIIDMLVRKGWNIKRVMNQWPAVYKKDFGNRGAE